MGFVGQKESTCGMVQDLRSLFRDGDWLTWGNEPLCLFTNPVSFPGALAFDEHSSYGS